MDTRGQQDRLVAAPEHVPYEAADGAWRDPARPVGERVADLLARMTVEEKLAQLVGVWLRGHGGSAAGDGGPGDGGDVAPMQDQLAAGLPPLAELARHGLGQLTRVFGTEPVDPAEGAGTLSRLQAEVAAANRFGIPAVAHEECLTGFATWTATAFPAPPAWGASFDPDTVHEMAEAIGRDMRAVGIHQGLAPVLDVARDLRWGRVEETIAEDPYLVGTLGTAYVQGLQSAGVIATLKHFAGYSASRAGRNLAPVAIGQREFSDVIVPPFEMAIRGGARSVMAAYTDTDGLPAAADPGLLTSVLRDQLGFDGVVVADYFGISFLETLHGVAGSPVEAGALALEAGVDVELPTVRCFGPAMAEAVRAGRVPVELVDRAAGRVLRQKCELGLLDPGWSPGPGGGPAGGGRGGAGDGHGVGPDLDPPSNRDIARRLAESSVVLLANGSQVLPLNGMLNGTARLAVVGPLADDPLAFLGCYTFPRHVGGGDPGSGPGIAIPTVLSALRQEMPQARIAHQRGCDVQSGDRSQLGPAVAAARSSDLIIAVLGDEAGLFGRGTSGEGCDVDTLRLPGAQAELLDQLIATGVPVVLVLVSGRPYALGPAARKLAAAVQAFFPGEEGGAALAGVLSGRVVPSGKLPVGMPLSYGAQPSTYLRAPLADRSEVSSVDPTELFPFGHGLSYTTFEYAGLSISPAGIPTDGTAEVACTVRNTGSRPGAEVVQLYLRDPVAQVVRPVRSLAGFARVPLEPGQSRRVTFRLHADRTAFHGRTGTRIVEPGLIEVEVGASSADLPLRGQLTLHGPERTVGSGRVLTTPVTVHDA
jgi:beta-xylosidase